MVEEIDVDEEVMYDYEDAYDEYEAGLVRSRSKDLPDGHLNISVVDSEMGFDSSGLALVTVIDAFAIHAIMQFRAEKITHLEAFANVVADEVCERIQFLYTQNQDLARLFRKMSVKDGSPHELVFDEEEEENNG